MAEGEKEQGKRTLWVSFCIICFTVGIASAQHAVKRSPPRYEPAAVITAFEVLDPLQSVTSGTVVHELSLDEVDEATIRVDLLKPIPVLIVYGTAVAREDGQVHFFEDTYKYDADLERGLTRDDSQKQ